jgi:hypothetical protein
MCDALVRHSSEYTIVQWIRTTLEGHMAVATLNETEFRDIQGLPSGKCAVTTPTVPGGILSTYQAQWRWLFIQGYADDICLLAVSKFPNTVSGVMQWALSTIEIWCNEVRLSVIPDKTGLVAFTRKRKLQGSFEQQLFGVKLSLSGSVKYLGVILDSQLTWTEHVEVKVRKAHNLLWACRRACGMGWGLGLKVVQ